MMCEQKRRQRQRRLLAQMERMSDFLVASDEDCQALTLSVMARGEEKAVMITAMASDGSRDPAIESVSNLWLLHHLSLAGLPLEPLLAASSHIVSFEGRGVGICSPPPH